MHCAMSESESEVESSGEDSSVDDAVLLRTAMLVPDTRAMCCSISQMKGSDEKEALRKQLCGFLAAVQASAADGRHRTPCSAPVFFTCVSDCRVIKNQESRRRREREREGEGEGEGERREKREERKREREGEGEIIRGREGEGE